jgi:hypothetical protein
MTREERMRTDEGISVSGGSLILQQSTSPIPLAQRWSGSV